MAKLKHTDEAIELARIEWQKAREAEAEQLRIYSSVVLERMSSYCRYREMILDNEEDEE